MNLTRTKPLLLTLFLTISLLLPSAIKALAAEVTLQDIVVLILSNKPLFTMAESRGIVLPPLIKKVLLTGILTQQDLDGISSSNTSNTYNRDLTIGSSGSDVTTIQTYLINKNIGPQARILASSGVSGYFGLLSKAALIEYQTSINLYPSGVLDLNTRNYLNKSTTSSTSSTGGTVRSGGGGGGGGTPPPVVTPPVIPAPTLTFSTSASSITNGQSATLTWSTTNATSCTASNGWSGTQSTSGTQSVSPTATTTYGLSCSGSGGTAIQNVVVGVNASGGDVTPPVLSSGSPSGALAVSTMQVTLSVTTNEAASCRYSNSSGQLYGNMSLFLSGTGTSHTATVSGLKDGINYTNYVRCMDASGNSNIADYAVIYNVVSNEPQPTVSNTIRWQDNFDSYNGIISSDPTPYVSQNYAMTATHPQIIAGRGGTGEALRFTYDSDYVTTGQDPLIEHSFTESPDIYFSYWYRLSPGADPTSGNQNPSGMKWFMTWRPTQARYTHGVGNLTGGPLGFENSGLEFGTHDNSSTQEPNGFSQNIRKDIKFGTTNDGNWHRYTLHVVTGPTGYEQIWVDGSLVTNSQGTNYDHGTEGINLVQFPGLIVSGPFAGYNFTLDIDDYKVWVN